MKIRSFQEELLMKQGQLGISTCHHCVDKGKGQSQVLQDSWWVIDVGGLLDYSGSKVKFLLQPAFKYFS